MSKTETFVFPRPISPTKDELRPNPHPYNIKTSSSGVLSRSNSNASQSGGGHHYVPSPSPSPSRANKKMTGHGHRYSRSLSSDGPRPLPIPPQSPSEDVFAESPASSDSPRRARRADTLPTPPGGVQQRLPALDELPSNPKAWTPSQLSLYLSTTLRVRSRETLQLPAPVAQDIANFVRESKISGRSFLRMKEDDLAQFEINKLWRSALLSASRSLRQSVLKGRIWGFGSAIEETPCSPISASDDDTTPHRRRRSTSLHETHSSNPFLSGSSSVESLRDASPVRRESALTGRFRNGRVKGMVKSFERSGSLDEGTPISAANASSGSSIYDTADAEDSDNTYATATARPSSSRPLPIPPSESPIVANSGDELPMEELLRQEGIYPKSHKPTIDGPDTFVNKRRVKRGRGVGVHAWEAEADGFEDRVTIKRVMPIPGTGIEELFALAPIASGPSSKVDAAITSFDENKLEAEIEDTKRLIGQLRKRIEVVEKKVDNMEARETEREREEREEADKRRRDRSPAPAPAPPPASILGRAFYTLFGRDALSKLRASKSKYLTSSYFERLAEPTTLTGLPSYFFLVGLGVCAVVLKVLMRKSAIIGLVNRRR
ncbi:hypothetical protein BDZ89DRAFT_1156218 [Hymenopellis radicata]|nr:hypothetical protein BDZ89DRAFT_1156218 [Hymenopellis radicata]